MEEFTDFLWSAAKLIGLVLCILIFFYACSAFVEEQGPSAWWIKR